MVDRQDPTGRSTRALIAASRDLCALSDLAVRHARATIDRTAALLAETEPDPFLKPARWRIQP